MLDLEARLLDVTHAAAYLGVSTDTIKGYVATGYLRRVLLPSERRLGEDSRRLLLDRLDLDVFVEHRKALSPVPVPMHERIRRVAK